MIISIDGATGQGKSEVLSALQEEGYTVCYLPKMDGVTEFKAHQERLLAERIEKINAANERGEDLIVESSFSDIIIYTLFTVGLDYNHVEWIDDFCDRCNAATVMVDHTLLLPPSTSDISRWFASVCYELADWYHDDRPYSIVGLVYDDVIEDVKNCIQVLKRAT